MLKIKYSLATGIPELTTNEFRPKALSEVDVEILFEGGTLTSVAGLGLALRDRDEPGVLATAPTFIADPQNARRYTGILELRDQRLADFLAGENESVKLSQRMLLEMLGTVNGRALRAQNIPVTVESNVADGPTVDPGDQYWYTAAEIDEKLSQLGGGGSGEGNASTLNGFAGAYYLNRANHTGTQAISTVTGLQVALDGKAASSHAHAFNSLTGTPTTLAGYGITDAATPADITAAVGALVGASPAALDTLFEIAAALGDDPNFAATLTTSIGTKLAKSANLSDLTNASTARTNLGLAIGVDVQAFSSTLTSWAAKAVPAGTVVGTTDAQTLTGKTIDGASNTLAVRAQDLVATGTRNATTFYCGDGTWKVPPGSGEGGGPFTSADITDFNDATNALIETALASVTGEVATLNTRLTNAENAIDAQAITVGDLSSAVVIQSDAITSLENRATDAENNITNLSDAVAGKAPLLYPVGVSDSTKTLDINDAWKWFRCSNASGCVVTVPPQSSATWAEGTEIAFEQTAAGTVEIVAGSGVTLNCSPSYQPKTAEQYAVVMIKRTQTTNVWTITGERMPA